MDEKEILQKEEQTPKKTEKILPENGIANDKYDVSEPWVEAVPLPEEEAEEGVTFSYDFNGEEIETALKLFQKKMLFKKNIIYSCIFVVIELLYLNTLAKNPDYTVGKVMAVLCVVAILYIWYMPWSHVRNLKKATDSMETLPQFKMTVGEQGFINYDENNKPFLIPYTGEKVRAIETLALYTIIISKEKCFVVPKRCLQEGQAEEITGYLKQGLGEKYEFLNK